jgi:hypothetical protein
MTGVSTKKSLNGVAMMERRGLEEKEQIATVAQSAPLLAKSARTSVAKTRSRLAYSGQGRYNMRLFGRVAQLVRALL